ncbi:nitroreductase family protein [Paracoccus aminophilus]|uniref:Nitroreductase domain-containing protein n=1 Tax=Paracoccus aminophilus JCM 7686 TaxID=1367847 RepID=S5Y074_PARAH|nr:nitroreductase family protein [Paracoccus aminophilus]AGT10942.1 hypothetical protein JCM7686_pAMI4p252 [Paracoccus aminophilus JCM 7686]
MNKVTADMMQSSFTRDPELKLPVFPKFPREIVMAPFGASGILFDGIDGLQLISGAGARHFIPRLIEKLDGSRGLPEIVAEFPSVRPDKIMGAVALLYSRGLLEDGGDLVPETPLAGFLGRHIDATRVNGNRAEALARLNGARVALIPSDGAQMLAEALADCGLGEVMTLGDPSDLSCRPDLVIAFHDAKTSADDWLAQAWSLGLPALHLCVGETLVEVGPLFVPGLSASPACFRRLQSERPEGVPRDLEIWAAVAAMHVQNIISRIGRMSLYNLCHLHRRHPGEPPSYAEVKLTRWPGEITAGLGHIEAAPAADPEHLVWRLHNAANGMPPRSFLSPRDYQMHYSAANLRATAQRPDPYFGAPAQALPGSLDLDLGAGADVDMARLAALLRFAAGYDGPHRITPSAGGLGAVNLYVVTRNVAGLPPRTGWHYDATEHQLCRLGSVSDEDLCAMLGVTLDELPAVVAFGIATTEKSQRKYNSFAFRFAQLDSGIMRAVLSGLAEKMGIELRDYPNLRDISAAQALGVALRGTANIVTFAAGFGRGAETMRAAYPDLRQGQEVTQLAELAAHLPLTKAQPLPDLAPSDLTAADFPRRLLSRRSVRIFAKAPLPLHSLAQIAHSVSALDLRLDAQGALPARTTLWFAIPAHIDAENQGIWRKGPTGELVRIRQNLTSDELAQGMLQRSLADAPLTILITGRFHDAVDLWGARGYRELYARAGAAAMQALQVGLSLGLGGCPWGGISESAWGELLGIDRYTDCPLFGVSMGVPADAQTAGGLHV